MLAITVLTGTRNHGDCHWHSSKMNANEEVVIKHIILYFFNKERTNRKFVHHSPFILTTLHLFDDFSLSCFALTSWDHQKKMNLSNLFGKYSWLQRICYL